MEAKIIEDTKQPLFLRRLIIADIDFGEGKTPSRADVRNEVAKALKSNWKNLSVRKIDTAYGYRKAKVEAYLYESEAALKKSEPKHISLRDAPKQSKEGKGDGETEAPKAEEKKAEEIKAKEEKPKEEKAE